MVQLHAQAVAWVRMQTKLPAQAVFNVRPAPRSCRQQLRRAFHVFPAPAPRTLVPFHVPIATQGTMQLELVIVFAAHALRGCSTANPGKVFAPTAQPGAICQGIRQLELAALSVTRVELQTWGVSFPVPNVSRVHTQAFLVCHCAQNALAAQ